MRALFSIVLLSLGLSGYAQTAINKIIPMQAGQKVQLEFDYPELIKVTTWDRNEISIQGSVSINGGENDDAFQLSSALSGNTWRIESEVRNLKNLPHRITVMENGKKMVFKNKAALKTHDPNNYTNYKFYSEGVEMDIVLEIKIPKNMATDLRSVYGIVEVKNFEGELTVDATYGAVDATVNEATTGQLKAETNYGQIYTNLALKIAKGEEEDFHTLITAKLGNGPDYNFESKYGNVYLRKSN
ncbi:MAG: hypothetical protein HOP30_11725 [Cyclobacteriaceae bacterium]|nr:hypothetical protein [Cyclobacteriaceae bacterium]